MPYLHRISRMTRIQMRIKKHASCVEQVRMALNSNLTENIQMQMTKCIKSAKRKNMGT